MKTTTMPDARKVARIIKPHAAKYLAARAYAEVMQDVIRERSAPLLAAANILDESGRPIADSRNLYLAADGQEDAIAAFYEAAKAANIAAGWKGNPERCPFLVADMDRVRAENELLDAGFAAMGNPELKAIDVYGDNRKKAVDLFCGLALATPR